MENIRDVTLKDIESMDPIDQNFLNNQFETKSEIPDMIENSSDPRKIKRVNFASALSRALGIFNPPEFHSGVSRTTMIPWAIAISTGDQRVDRGDPDVVEVLDAIPEIYNIEPAVLEKIERNSDSLRDFLIAVVKLDGKTKPVEERVNEKHGRPKCIYSESGPYRRVAEFLNIENTKYEDYMSSLALGGKNNIPVAKPVEYPTINPTVVETQPPGSNLSLSDFVTGLGEFMKFRHKKISITFEL